MNRGKIKMGLRPLPKYSIENPHVSHQVNQQQSKCSKHIFVDKDRSPLNFGPPQCPKNTSKNLNPSYENRSSNFSCNSKRQQIITSNEKIINIYKDTEKNCRSMICKQRVIRSRLLETTFYKSYR